jgi:hypothetical protein
MKSYDVLFWGFRLGKNEDAECDRRGCVDCKRAICGSKVFCSWLKKFVEKLYVDGDIEFVICPRFEVEPLEYKTYKRT